MHKKKAVYLKYKPALRLPDGLFAVPKPNEVFPDELVPKAELLPNPSETTLDKNTCNIAYSTKTPKI